MDSPIAETTLNAIDTVDYLRRYVRRCVHLQVEVAGQEVGIFPVVVERVGLNDGAGIVEPRLAVVFAAEGHLTLDGDPYFSPFISIPVERFMGGVPSGDFEDVIALRDHDRTFTFWPVRDGATAP